MKSSIRCVGVSLWDHVYTQFTLRDAHSRWASFRAILMCAIRDEFGGHWVLGDYEVNTLGCFVFLLVAFF